MDLINTVGEDVVKKAASNLGKKVKDLTPEETGILFEELTKQQEAVLLENVELKNMAASTKLKAEVKVGTNNPINLKSKELSTEDTLSALSRIVKKNKK